MKVTGRRQIVLFLNVFILLATATAAQANTLNSGSLYQNNSDKPWKVKFIMFDGYAKLDNKKSECTEDQECTIAAKSSIIIVYKTKTSFVGSLFKGMLIVTDYQNHRKIYNIDSNGIAPLLSPLDNDCPDDIDINMTSGGYQGGIRFKYASLCWPGNL